MQLVWDEWIGTCRSYLLALTTGQITPGGKAGPEQADAWKTALTKPCTNLNTRQEPGHGLDVYEFSKLVFFGRSGSWMGLLDTDELEDLLEEAPQLIEGHYTRESHWEQVVYNPSKNNSILIKKNIRFFMIFANLAVIYT